MLTTGSAHFLINFLCLILATGIHFAYWDISVVTDFDSVIIIVTMPPFSVSTNRQVTLSYCISLVSY